MDNRNILISGAGIAGPCLAYWLKRYGFAPVLVEQAPVLRQGGYVVDFWGLGFDIAGKMNLLPGLRQDGYPIEEVRFVDGHGRVVGGFRAGALRHVMGDRFVSLLRSDLSLRIYQALDGTVPTLFGDSIAALDQDESGVMVSFRHAPPRRFDLVIGAGGLHSPVRGLVFGPQDRFEKYLGYCTASFSVTDYPHADPNAYVSYAEPGRQVSRYSLRGGRTVFFFVFAHQHPGGIAGHDPAAQKALLRQVYAADGWECPQILDALDSADDLYFDAVSQIRMPRWTQGRVALVGDACASPSLVAGQGAALAMLEAYVLAGELHKAGGDHRAAFAAYETLLQPFLADKLRAAEGFASSFVPRTRIGLLVRNQVTRILNWPLVLRLFVGRTLTDRMDLPVYG